ncbi:SH3 domain-containing protein [Ruminococcus sp. HUN007]|uniref:glycoside hydrolase family protein n=1 Tax=Ruminococcus sp. HUN007 TaxID=1514668 RepID=UPI00067918B2|nr:SH3 domain-containing protein [Ruminococcus sp. HUN007]
MKRKCMSLLLALTLAGSDLFSEVYSVNDKCGIVCSASSYQISENGLALIKSFEGFSKYAQWDYHQWSIGYGTGVDKDAYPDGITEAEADRLLREVVVVYEKFVRNFLDKYGISVTQNQYDALVSFTYNMGNVWNNTSEVTIRTYLVNGIENYTPEQITDAFKLWCKAGGQVLPGLVRRRETEAALFLSGVDYSANETGEKWRVTSSTGIRLRSSADTSAEIINVIPYNHAITVDEKKESGGFLWGRTSYGGTDGWCVLDYAEHIRGEVETVVEPDEEKFDQYSITSTTGVRLRYNHGTDFDILDVVPYEAVITVYETFQDSDYLWGRTEYNGKPGWCVLNYARKLGTDEPPVDLVLRAMPQKLDYLAGEIFENAGMVVAACYSDGREEIVEDYGCEGNTMVPGDSIITVDYKGASCGLIVRVKARRGDINRNGTFDPEDNYCLKQHILGASENDITESGDINGDGIINIFDTIHIKHDMLAKQEEAEQVFEDLTD